jgi:hypothetical protein
MDYYIDTEFLEGTQKESFPISLFRKNTPPTIDLISIGIVAEDGREYYSISKDFNLKEAWNRFEIKDYDLSVKKEYWIRDNVLKPIFIELFKTFQSNLFLRKNNKRFYYDYEIESGSCDFLFTLENFKKLINRYGKTNKQIAEEIKSFCLGIDYWQIAGIANNKKSYPENIITISKEKYFINKECLDKIKEMDATKVGLDSYDIIRKQDNEPKFYAYYADYDWVVFCWIFGKMMDLPSGFPKYCNDLKQILEEKAKSMTTMEITDAVFGKGQMTHNVYSTLDSGILKSTKSKCLMNAKDYSAPYLKKENKHSAIHDARWNKKLHEFLNTI